MTNVTRLTLDENGGLNNRRIHLREISGDLDAPLETVGQDLRAARLRRGDDLATVSRALKIRKDHLEALEEDRMESLPGRTYAVGFVRSYADYLGLDAVQCVERFKAEIAGRNDGTAPQVTVIDEDEHRRLPQGWKIIAGFVVLLVIYGAYQLAVSADRMLTQPPEAPPQPLVTKPMAHESKPAPRAPVQSAATAPAPAVSAPPAQTGAPSQAGAQPQPAVSSAGKSALLPGILPSGTALDGSLPQSDVPLPAGQVYGEQNRNARVILRVRQTTRVLVQGPDGMVYINRTLNPGDSYRVPNLVGLTLTTTNAGAVEVDLDGLSMGTAGRNQQTTEALSLDPQDIVDRYNGGHPG